MQYTLKHAGAVAIADTLGGELISYITKDGKEQVWCGDANYWTGHAPVLFPIVGALLDDKINISGKSYSLAKHGFARKSEFDVSNVSENAITFTLKAHDATLAQFPFEFVLDITHTLNDDGFTTTYNVKNNSAEDMPFCIGGHAGFACPINEGEKFEDYQLVFDKAITEKKPLYTDSKSIMHTENRLNLEWDGTTLPLNHKDFDIDVYIFDDIPSHSVRLAHKSTGEGVTFDFCGFSQLGIWSPPGKNAPFVCLEPWQGLPAYENETGNFEDKPHIVRLAKGEDYKAGYKVTCHSAK